MDPDTERMLLKGCSIKECSSEFAHHVCSAGRVLSSALGEMDSNGTAFYFKELLASIAGVLDALAGISDVVQECASLYEVAAAECITKQK